MKKLNWYGLNDLIWALAAMFLLLVAYGAFGQTNAEAPPAATNLNQVMIEILSSGHAVGSEIYQASKSAIKKSVDFATEQAPDVVRQFLHWKLAEALIWLAMWVAMAALCFWLAYRLKAWAIKNPHDSDCGGAVGGRWVLIVAGAGTLIISIGMQGIAIAQITIAPKVYIIEYVVGLAGGVR